MDFVALMLHSLKNASTSWDTKQIPAYGDDAVSVLYGKIGIRCPDQNRSLPKPEVTAYES